ncbi:hypothetical protein BLA29_012253, partial [Euroglyphus maynei]
KVVNDSNDKSSSNDEECIESKSSNPHHDDESDNKSIIANGRINKLSSENHHSSHNIGDSASDTHDESDKTESESDESTSLMTNDRCDWQQQQQQQQQNHSDKNELAKSDNVVSTPSRSPKHLLPKREALTLTFSNVTSTSVRLKWHFNNQNEQLQYCQQGSGGEQHAKRNYIVD